MGANGKKLTQAYPSGWPKEIVKIADLAIHEPENCPFIRNNRTVTPLKSIESLHPSYA